MNQLDNSALDRLAHDLHEAMHSLSMDYCRQTLIRSRDGLRQLLILRPRPDVITGATAMEWRLAKRRAEEAETTLNAVDVCMADIGQGPAYLQHRMYVHCAAEMLSLIRAERMQRKHAFRAAL